MSEVALNSGYAAQAAYNTQVNDPRHLDGAQDASDSGLSVQDSVDQAIVDALMLVLSKMAHNNGMPKNVLNQIIDFLQQYIASGGGNQGGTSGGATEDGAANGGGMINVAPAPSTGADTPVAGNAPTAGSVVHMEPGDELKIDGKSVIADPPGVAHIMMYDPNTIYVAPGQTVEVGGIKFTNDAPAEGAIAPAPAPSAGAPSAPAAPAMPSAPVVSAPSISTGPALYNITPEYFASKYTLPLQMADGTTVRATTSEAQQLFGIPTGTPLSMVDFAKLNASYQVTSEGLVLPSYRSPANGGTSATSEASAPAAAPAPASAPAAESSGSRNLLTDMVQAADAKKLDSQIRDAAGKIAENIGDTAEESVKTKKGNNANGAGPKGVTSKSWLMAIAEAMGGVLGQKVSQMLTSSQKMASLSQDGIVLGDMQNALTGEIAAWKKGHAGFTLDDWNTAKVTQFDDKQKVIDDAQKMNGQEFTLETTKLQGAAQEFSMLQNAFSNTLKSIGEGLGQLARKG